MSRLLPVRFEPSGVTVMVSSGTTLLEAARRAGFTMGSVCGGQGECGECWVQIIEGQVTVMAYESTRPSRIDFNVDTDYLACCTRVAGPIKVRILNR